MKTLLTWLCLASTLFVAKAQSLDPSDVLKKDGAIVITDGSSFYKFKTNGTFRSFSVGMSGRCFNGTWTSSAMENLYHFTVKAKEGWLNGIQPPPDDWKIVFAVYSGIKKPAGRLHPNIEVFDCYWIIDELTKMPKLEK